MNCGSPSQMFCNAEFIFCCIEHALLTKQSRCGDLRRRDSHGGLFSQWVKKAEF